MNPPQLISGYVCPGAGVLQVQNRVQITPSDFHYVDLPLSTAICAWFCEAVMLQVRDGDEVMA